MSDNHIRRHNQAALQTNHPDLIDLFRQPSAPASITLQKEKNGVINAVIPHPVSREQTKIHNPATLDTDINDLIDSFGLERECLVFLLGFGLGHEAVSLLEKLPDLRLVVIEPQRELFETALNQVDLTFVLNHTNVSLYIGETFTIEEILKNENDAMRALPLHLITHNTLLDLFPETYKPLKGQLQSELLHFKGLLDTVEKQGPMLFNNTASNIPRLAESAHIQAIVDITQDRPAVCVASGPSLTKNIHQLKDRENEFLIIAVDSAADILLDHRIKPHIIATIDPIPASLRKLEKIVSHHQDIPLLWAPEAFPETVRNFRGTQKFVIPGVNDLFRLHLASLYHQKRHFSHAVSVMHAAIQAGLLAGCRPLIGIGLDLAVSGNKDHAEGAPVSWKDIDQVARIKVPAWDGGEAETIPVLHNQLVSLEKLIRELQINFVDATEGGAYIQGSTTMTLQEALASYSPPKKDLDAAILQAFQEADTPTTEELGLTLQNFRKKILASQKVAQTGLKNAQESRKAWKLSRKSKKAGQHLKKCKKMMLRAGDAIEELMNSLDLANALYPLRAREHHRLVYARQRFNRTMEEKAPEKRLFEELDLDMDYFRSWLETTKETKAILAPIIKELAEAQKHEEK